MTYDHIDVERRDDQFHIVLDRAPKPNPMNDTTITEMDAAIDEFEAGDERVLVVRGAGDVFSVGGDISFMEPLVTGEKWDELMTFLRRGQETFTRLSELRRPTIAAVEGYALGGGLELALACDLRFATESTALGVPEVNIGMIPGWGGTQRLPRVVGKSAAKDMLLTGRHVPAPEAAEMGLVDEVVADGNLDDYAAEYAADLAEKPPETVKLILESVQEGGSNPLSGGLTYELTCNMFAGFTDEAQARLTEFVDN